MRALPCLAMSPRVMVDPNIAGTFLCRHRAPHKKSGWTFPSNRFSFACHEMSGAAAAAALGHLHAADRLVLPAVHAFDEVCVALPVAVALKGCASHRNSSLFSFRQDRAVGSGLFSLPTAHQCVRKTINIPPPLHKPDNCTLSYTSFAVKTDGKN